MNIMPQSWMSLLFPPERYELLEVQLSDDSIHRAVWTGAQFWCEGHAVKPQAWRPVRRLFAVEKPRRSA